MKHLYHNQNTHENIIELEKGFRAFYHFALSLIDQMLCMR